jgi:predicted TIM-barrel fold metal-dependent hydrolase
MADVVSVQSALDFRLDRIRRNGRAKTVTFIDEPEPEPLFCPIISVDDHVLEPPSLFEGRLPARFQDRAPFYDAQTDDMPSWVIGDVRVPMTQGNGAVGRVQSEWQISAVDYSEMRRGAWDPAARLRDMDLTGVWASLCFGSNIWGFAGTQLSKMKDAELGLHCLRAYNDWMIEEWCSVAPERFIPCQLSWLRDAEQGAAEVRRNAERGFRAVSFSENPEGLGFPNVYDPFWDPFFRACEETGTVINLHVGSSGQTRLPCSSSLDAVNVALFPLSAIEALIDWTFALVPLRFPGLTIALSEGGVSWVPMALERLRRAERQSEGLGRGWPASGPRIEEVVRRNFVYTSIEDPAAFQMLHLIGEDSVMVETDYPHYDSTWPESQAIIREALDGLPIPQIRKVCFENAARIYRHPLPPSDLVAGSAIGGQGTSTAG